MARDEHLLLGIAEGDEENVRTCGRDLADDRLFLVGAEIAVARADHAQAREPRGEPPSDLFRHARRGADQIGRRRPVQVGEQAGDEIRAVEIVREAAAFEQAGGDLETDPVVDQNEPPERGGVGVVAQRDLGCMGIAEGHRHGRRAGFERRARPGDEFGARHAQHIQRADRGAVPNWRREIGHRVLRGASGRQENRGLGNET